MVKRSSLLGMATLAALCLAPRAAAQDTGTIRGVVMDKDFEVPLAGVSVLNVDPRERVQTAENGIYTFTRHLRWAPVIGLGYAASIWVHYLISAPASAG